MHLSPTSKLGYLSFNMGSKTRLSTNCTKQCENHANLVTSREINKRLVHPIVIYSNITHLFCKTKHMVDTGDVWF